MRKGRKEGREEMTTSCKREAVWPDLTLPPAHGGAEKGSKSGHTATT